MRKLLLILLLLPLVASAEHHRQHAIDRLDAIGVTGLLLNLDYYQSRVQMDAYHQQRFDGAYHQIMVVGELRDAAWGHLANSTKSLGEIRRLMNQPHTNVKPHAALWRIDMAGYHLRRLVGVDPGMDYVITRTLGGLFSLSQKMDGVLWHINDAILEEQFGQP